MHPPVRQSIRLLTLGSLDLRDRDDRSVDRLLAQPRRMALLAYLAIAAPGRFHRRDSLIALFWPEREERRARDLLNTNLSRLRAALGGDAILRRGPDEVAVNPDRLWCDAGAFDRAVAEHRSEDAVNLYGGALLDGFHIDDAPQFDYWLDVERRRLRAAAAGAALDCADRMRVTGDVLGARSYCERALAISHSSEADLRRALSLLDAIGDRAAALEIYGSWTRRIRDEHGSCPSPETVALAARLRGPALAIHDGVRTEPERQFSRLASAS